jgi:hypothetical protein
MNRKTIRLSSDAPETMDLKTAVEQFVAQGGVIDKIPIGESCTKVPPPILVATGKGDTQDHRTEKVELLRQLVAKGAGFSSLQYSLKMNRKDIKLLAVEHGVKIALSKPLGSTHRSRRYDTSDVDDVVAGQAMHYSSLGYSAPEIAQILGLTTRQVWNIGKAYRFEFKRDKGDSAL